MPTLRTPRRTVLLLLFLAFASCVTAAQTAPAAKPAVYLPLLVVETTSWDSAPKIPTITIGSFAKADLPAFPETPSSTTEGDQPQANTFNFKSANTDFIAKVLAGKVHFASAPQTDTATFVLLVAPYLNIRHGWCPTEITLDGSTITLEVSASEGTPGELEQSGENFSRRSAYLISLGTLPAGDYKFALHCSYIRGTKTGGSEYSGTDGRATVPFSVAAAAANAGAPTTIAETDLHKTHVEAKPSDAMQIAARYWAYSADIAAIPPPTLQIGTYDAYKLLDGIDQVKHKTVPTPKGSPNNDFSGADLATIIAYPQLNTGEWIALHSITYSTEKHAITITVDYWHDNGTRGKNGIQTPCIIMPNLTSELNQVLTAGERAKGDFTVTLQWRSFLADSLGKPYTLQPPDPANKALATVTQKVTVHNP